VFATLTRTAGVYTNNSHSGTQYLTGITRDLTQVLCFHILPDSFALSQRSTLFFSCTSGLFVKNTRRVGRGSIRRLDRNTRKGQEIGPDGLAGFPHPLRGNASGSGALRVESHDLPGDFFDVGDAEQADGHLGYGIHIARTKQGVGAYEDVAGAVGALAVLHGDDVGRSAGLDGAVAGAADDHDALIGDGIDRAAALEIGPERSKDDCEAGKQERQAKQRKETEGLGKGVWRFGNGAGGVVGAVDPEKGEAGEGNAE